MRIHHDTFESVVSARTGREASREGRECRRERQRVRGGERERERERKGCARWDGCCTVRGRS